MSDGKSRINCEMSQNVDATEITVVIKSTDWIDPVQCALALTQMAAQVLASATGVVDTVSMTGEPGPFNEGKKMGEA